MSISMLHSDSGCVRGSPDAGLLPRFPSEKGEKVAFVENKSVDFQRVEQLLAKCALVNRWANKGPLYHQLADGYAGFFNLSADWAIVPCANCGIAFEALARLLALRRGRKLRWIAPSYSFVNIGRGYLSDVTFIDCDSEGLLNLSHLAALDPENYDGIIVVNPFGISDNLDLYVQFALHQGKELIFDNACGIGQRIPKWPWQSFSLHHTKPYGFGEGGLAIVPRDAADDYYSLIDYGAVPSSPGAWLGNGKISEIACAFHIERLQSSIDWAPQYIAQSGRIIELALKCGLQPLKHLNTLLPTTSLPFLFEREVSLNQINRSKHVTFGKYYKPQTNTPNAIDIFRRVVNIPTHPEMSILSDAEIIQDLERVQQPTI